MNNIHLITRKIYKSLSVLVAVFGVGVIFSFTTPEAFAADICWDGGGSTNNWSEGANWAGDAAPVAGVDGAVFDNTTCTGNPDKSVTIDVNSNIYTGINIASYTGTISLGANAIGFFAFTQASGTLNLDTGFIAFLGPFTRTGGTYNAGTGESGFAICDTCVYSGSTTFYDLVFATFSGSATANIASGTTFTVTNDLSMEGSSDTLNGPGVIEFEGDFFTGTDGVAGNLALTFIGTNNQTITTSGTSLSGGTWTINKPSGTVTLSSALSLDTSGQDLIISSGELDTAIYSLTVDDVFTINGIFTQGAGNVSADTYTVGASGLWENLSTGDIVVGSGGVGNAGTITLGDVNSCESSDEIAITSSSSGVQRSWSGAGVFNLYDLSVTDMGGSATLTAYSSTDVDNNDTNWTFASGCAPPPAEEDTSSIFQGGVIIQGGTLIQ